LRPRGPGGVQSLDYVQPSERKGRLLAAIAALKAKWRRAFFTAVFDQARAQGLLADEHFAVDGRRSMRGRDTRASSAKITLASTPHPTILAILASTFAWCCHPGALSWIIRQGRA
jgi:hypothetical protein